MTPQHTPEGDSNSNLRSDVVEARVRRRRMAWLWGLLGLIGAIVACVAVVKAPTPSNLHTLEPKLEGQDAHAAEFRVVHFGPVGPSAADGVISIVWSQPLRALDQAEARPQLPLRITPPVPGEWQWVGSNAVQFRPLAGALPRATAFRVELDAGVRSLTGQQLAEALQFSFSTPAPELVHHLPYEGFSGLEPNTRIVLQFDQPVTAAEIQRQGRLSVRGRALPFSVELDAEGRNVVIPTHPLPLASDFEFELLPGLRGTEGNLATERATRFSFGTYGPLTANVRCGWSECTPHSGLWIEFSTPVQVRDVKARLRLSPLAKPQWSEWLDDEEWVTSLGVSVELQPRTRHRVSFAPGLTDRYRQALTQVSGGEFTTGDYPPQLELGVEGELLEPSRVAELELLARNTGRYQLTTAPASPEAASEWSWSQELPTQMPNARSVWVDAGRSNQWHRHSLDLWSALGGASADPRRTRGPLFVTTAFQFSDPSATDRNPISSQSTRLLQITDLALSGKLSRAGSLFWITHLSSGLPAAGATLEIWEGGKVLRRYVADTTGIVRVPASEFTPTFRYHYEYYQRSKETAPTAFVARLGDDWTLRSGMSFLGPWRMPVMPVIDPVDSTTVYLFTERGIYRPGDRVWVKGIVRAANEGADAGGMRVVREDRKLSLRAPNGEEVLARRVASTEFGTFATEFVIPTGAELGSWQVVARRVSADPSEGENTVLFSVAEYRPAEFAVSVNAGPAPTTSSPGAKQTPPAVSSAGIVNGSTAEFSIQADYLYGAPMAGADARYFVSYEPTRHQPPNTQNWVTDDTAYLNDLDTGSTGWGTLAHGEAKLDALGRWQLGQRLELPQQVAPSNVRFEAEVSDASRQAIAASTQILVHPAEIYVGLEQLQDYFVSAPGAVKLSVAAFTPFGVRVPGRRVSVEVSRRRFTSERVARGAHYDYVTRHVDERVGSCALTTTSAAVNCEVSLKEGGYYIARAEARDAGGRLARASLAFYGLGAGRLSWRDDSQSNHVELNANQRSYKVGETAKILIKSPFETAEALVTLERAGVLEHRRITVKGPTPTLEIPITDRLRPNVYVSVHLLAHRKQPAKPVLRGEELYRVGTTELLVDPEARRLTVEVVPQQRELAPGDTVIADVSVRDRDGRPRAAELTFFAVDEGVLSLSGYQLPDPVPAFTGPRPLQVATLESRADLARLFQPQGRGGDDKGGVGGGGGNERAVFRQSAYFNPNLRTDASGKVRVSFELPDDLTTFRLMAVAVTTDDRYGSAQSSVRVSKPLMARPALPRFLRAGDRFEPSVVVSTRGARSRQVDVSLKAQGLELEGPTSQRVEVSSDGVVEVRFRARAAQAGKAELRFEVSGRGERDAVRLEREVRNPSVLETVAAYGETTGAEGQRLGDLKQLRADVGGLEVRLASTRLLGLDASMEQLVEYPYACTEQLGSRILPLLPLAELAREFGFSVPDAKRLAEHSAGEIVNRQRSDGGWGFWSEAPMSHGWVSAYALWSLKQASRHGVRVPKAVFERGIKYLRSDLLHRVNDVTLWMMSGRTELWDSPDLLAFAAFVLAELDAPELAAIERLSGLTDRLGTQGLAWLSLAASKSKAPDVLRKPLIERLESKIALNGQRAVVQGETAADARLLSSPLRTQALVTSALLEHDPRHPLAGKLVSELLARREGGGWRTTQESAFALLALDSYWRKQERAAPNFDATVWVGSEPVLTQAFRGRSTTSTPHQVEMARLHQGGGLDLVVERRSPDTGSTQGTLFYEARLRYATRELPTTPLDRGFSIDKLVRPVTPEQLEQIAGTLGAGSDRVTAGQLALVDLLLVTPVLRRFVVIDDPLAAGLEAFDAKLATSSRTIADASRNAPLAKGFSEAWHRSELRDDRALFFADELPPGMYHFRYVARATTLGSFVVPPTRAFEMYQPEIYGRTASSALHVVANAGRSEP